MAAEDWVVATYRDAALNWRAGYPWRLLTLGRTGDERGGELPEGINILPPSIERDESIALLITEPLDGSRLLFAHF